MTAMQTLFPELTLVPVVVIDEADKAVPLAEALLEGGVGCIEITLRTEAGLPAIEAIAKQVPNMLVGAGTVTTAEQMHAARDAGARFQVSPGITETLADQAQSMDLVWLPGTASASDVILALEHGFTHLKLFPATIVGGIPMLKQMASVFPDGRFCPTGGVNRENMNDFGALPNVFAIGGSWLTPKDAVARSEWQMITQIAKESVAELRL